MNTGTEKRRHPRRKPFASQRDLNMSAVVSGTARKFPAKVIDVGRGGVRVEIPYPLEPGEGANISGDIEDAGGRQQLDEKCTVSSCHPTGSNGKFVVGLVFGAKDSSQATTSSDHYEVLQLSRNADFDTVQRVFRILAQRYHPDNQETGNAELFQQAVEAHRVLSDPERRAAYDLQTRGQAASRFKLFDTWQDTQGAEAERRIRRGVLKLLYRQRQTNPRRPEVSLVDVSEALGVPREHLEFSLWFLRESKWIKMGDSGRLEITHSGVLAAEADDDHGPAEQPQRAIEAPVRSEQSA